MLSIIGTYSIYANRCREKQKWKFDSSESPDQQRKRLVKEFIQAGPERLVSFPLGCIANARHWAPSHYVRLKALVGIDHQQQLICFSG